MNKTHTSEVQNNNFDKDTLGCNIRRWRKFRDIKQDVFAKQIGVSRIMLSRYENGRSKISAETIYKISFHLDISFGELVKPF